MWIFDRDIWDEIFNSLGKSKIRTALTAIGVVWGVFLFVGLQGAAQGLQNGFKRSFSDYSNTVFVWGENTSKPYDGFQRGRSVHLEMSDIELAKSKVFGIDDMFPRIGLGMFGSASPYIVRKNRSSQVSVMGDMPGIIKVDKKDFLEGRFLNQQDQRLGRKVAVISEMAKEELFERGEEAVGEYIKINSVNFKIIGVTQKSQGGGPGGSKLIQIPFKTFQKVFNTGQNIGWIVLNVNNDYDSDLIKENLLTELKKKKNIHPEDDKAFGSFNLGKEFVQKAIGLSDGIKFFTYIVGIATLIAGVVAIGSILLITVKERTKEIGVRRAIGAKPWEIKRQIIFEAVILTVISGFIGLILAVGALFLTNTSIGDDNNMFFNATVSIYIVFGALFLMIAMGVLIGLIPANRAVSIKPIDALREE